MCHTFAEGRREAAAGCPSGPHREVGLWRRHLRGRKDRTPSCLAPPSLRETDWKDVKKCEKIQKLCQLWCSPSVPSVLKKHQETISSDLHVPFLLEEITQAARSLHTGRRSAMAPHCHYEGTSAGIWWMWRSNFKRWEKEGLGMFGLSGHHKLDWFS